MMEFVFIISLVTIVAFLGKVIANGLSKGENFYEYSKTEKQAKCSYEDYKFMARKFGR